MESRIPRGPPSDYTSEIPRGIYVNYEGTGGPAPTREPSWQNKLLGIVGSLVVAGILAIFGILWSMNTNQAETNGRLSKIEEHQIGEHNLVNQRLDAMDKHLEATDRQVNDLNREVWPHKH